MNACVCSAAVDAGQYIPTLMDQIHTKGGINLKGAAVGNVSRSDTWHCRVV
jgi:hypothetical protein